MVRMLAIADEVDPLLSDARLRSLIPDLVVSAGDLPWDHLEHVVSVTGAPALFVPGNHEPPSGAGEMTAPPGMRSLDGAVVEVAGLRLAGLGGCVRYNGGDHQYTQEEYEARAAALCSAVESAGEPLDVLVTHTPPLGLGDDTDPSHRGIAALHAVIERLCPTWHLHGHLHPHGMHKPDRALGATTIRNVIPWSLLEIEPRRKA
ncbi:metallophosphoesterase family protein [Aeromicrobium sp. CF3.5]|uniref:metallophosphoesterase family protein n=1 Tax=Aeromicrobium sp. CF3.5 TaxID=3373078 RepID=UPI003EE4CACD